MSPRATRRSRAHRAPRPLRVKAALAGAGVLAVGAVGMAAAELMGSTAEQATTVALDTGAPGADSPAPSTSSAAQAPVPPSTPPAPTRAAPKSSEATKPATPSKTAKPAAPRTVRPTTAAPKKTATKKPAAPKPDTGSQPAGGGQTAEVVRLVNVERAAAGCGSLSVDGDLTEAAQGYSDTMAATGNFSHTGTDGSQPDDRIEAAGYDWSGYGENIAMGQADAAAVVDAWMNSPGHRANILNCKFTEIGVGLNTDGGPWWTQNFGTPG
ncbi:CAP domain-containing protein [Streptomyces bambusae]|uniref:CAP domain-containing protein n=1 Tax=Streptomyces bambusae TaxID=1550616 RepID=UPI001CFEA259|nr:CAP domain-containing protein [Streptomyces bambusae]MCB5164578.1 CAP domain-containing protein [Streptomyces bambusae]